MRHICVFFGEMSKEYQRYMFLKQSESLKISSRFHSNFKEYFVLKMKSRDFAFGCFQTLQVRNMKSRDFDAKSRDFAFGRFQRAPSNYVIKLCGSYSVI